MSSMETNHWSTPFVTAVAPIAWGSTYLVTEQFLPPDRPLFAATVRALPVGLVLLAFRHRLPRGDWWWKAIVLGLCNIGMFFPLIFLAAYHLPGGLAATLQATSPLAVMGIAWLLIGERAGIVRVAAARRRPGRRRSAGGAQPRRDGRARAGRRVRLGAGQRRSASC